MGTEPGDSRRERADHTSRQNDTLLRAHSDFEHPRMARGRLLFRNPRIRNGSHLRCIQVSLDDEEITQDRERRGYHSDKKIAFTHKQGCSRVTGSSRVGRS